MQLSEGDLRVCPACRAVYAPNVEKCPKHHLKMRPVPEFVEWHRRQSMLPGLSVEGLFIVLSVMKGASDYLLLLGLTLAALLFAIYSSQHKRLARDIRAKASAFVQQWAAERDETLEMASGMLSDYNPQGALKAVTNAESKGFGGYEFSMLRAKSLYGLGKFDEALTTLEQIDEAYGSTHDVAQMLALSYVNAGHSSANSLQKIESLICGLDASERIELLARLVRSAREIGRYDAVHATVIRLALADMPNDLNTICAAAEYARADGNPEQAVAHLQKLPLDQHSSESLGLWAASLTALNRMDSEAEMVYSRYLQSNPLDSEIRVALGNIFVREKRHEEAEHLYQAGIELDPSSARLWYNLALTRMQAGRYEDAIGTLQSFMKTDSWDSYRAHGDVHRIMGICMMRQGTLRQALKQFQMADRSMQTLDRLYELAGMFELQGDLPSARACYDDIYAEDITYKDVAEKIRTTWPDAPRKQ
jgi:tetratricopeptide (TPR) repeat protein